MSDTIDRESEDWLQLCEIRERALRRKPGRWWTRADVVFLLNWDVAVRSERDQLRESLADMLQVIEGLEGQQAMPDDSHKQSVAKARAVLEGKCPPPSAPSLAMSE